MNYELAKELKEAGFTQKETGRGFVQTDLGPAEITIEYGDKGYVYIPTLSELIEACGEGFGKLVKDGHHWYAYDSGRTMNPAADTPEEAVASLWLAL